MAKIFKTSTTVVCSFMNSQKKKSLKSKMDKRFEHTLHKEEHRIRHEKLLNLKATSEIKIKTTMNYCSIPIRLT